MWNILSQFRSFQKISHSFQKYISNLFIAYLIHRPIWSSHLPHVIHFWLLWSAQLANLSLESWAPRTHPKVNYDHLFRSSSQSCIAFSILGYYSAALVLVSSPKILTYWEAYVVAEAIARGSSSSAVGLNSASAGELTLWSQLERGADAVWDFQSFTVSRASRVSRHFGWSKKMMIANHQNRKNGGWRNGGHLGFFGFLLNEEHCLKITQKVSFYNKSSEVSYFQRKRSGNFSTIYRVQIQFFYSWSKKL